MPNSDKQSSHSVITNPLTSVRVRVTSNYSLFAAKFFISLSEKNVIIRRIIGTAAVVSSASRRKTRASTPRSGAAPRSHLVGAPLGLRGSNLVNSGGAASSPTRRAQKSICSPLCWTITTNTGYPRIHNCRMSSPLTRMVRKLS